MMDALVKKLSSLVGEESTDISGSSALTRPLLSIIGIFGIVVSRFVITGGWGVPTA
jgi:hypothetical protein